MRVQHSVSLRPNPILLLRRNYANFDEHIVWAQFSAKGKQILRISLSGSRFGAESEDFATKLIISVYREDW